MKEWKVFMIRLNLSDNFFSVVLLLSVLASAGCISKCRTGSDYCASKYPVLLIHGVAFRDQTFFIKYWGNIPSALKKDGAKVYTGKQQAYGTIKNNALQLKERVDEILKITGSDKINIIAHSRGGLEARYMISMLGMENKVASLTTLATPHRGSTMADYIIKHAADKKLLAVVIDFYAKVIGDTSPESLNAGIELTTLKMKEFNKTVKDSGSVYYQSYACAIDNSFFNPLWRSMYNLIAVSEGSNDGLVSVKSAKWGIFRGVVNCNGKALVTHADIVGMHFLSGEKCFDAEDFIRNIVHELKVSGY
jgi:triacylglycerol lipase